MNSFFHFRRGRRGIAKVAGVLLIILFIILFGFFVSAKVIDERDYVLGEDLKIDLSNYDNYLLKIITPDKTFLKEGSSPDILLFNLDKEGKYEVDLISGDAVKKYFFEVFKTLNRTKEDISEKEVTSNISLEGNFKVDSSDKLSNRSSLLNPDVISVGKPVFHKEIVLLKSTENSFLEVPSLAENISIVKDGKELQFESFNQRRIAGIFSSDKNKRILLKNVEGNVTLEYFTPAPRKVEKDLSPSIKEVVVSAPELGYTNVLASTNISELVKGKSQIKVLWKEEGRYLNFNASDSDGDGYLDTVSWIVPHLSTQTFEVILVRKAEHLDVNRNFISDVYPLVQFKDYNFTTISNGEYLRVHFERNLTNKNDITIYARGSGAKIEVYKKGESEKLADFGVIGGYTLYKILLGNLTGQEDTFDLKVVGGSVDFDYVLDPSFHELDSDSFEDQDWYTTIKNVQWVRSTTGGDLDIYDERASNGTYSVRAGNTKKTNQTWSLIVNASGYTNVSVEYWRAETGSWEADDYFMFEWYNGSSWHVEEQIFDDWGSTFVYKRFNLSSAADNNENLMLNFTHSNPTNGNSEEVWFDGFVVKGYGNKAPESPSPKINSTDGTGLEGQDLNCFDILDDSDGDNMNVSVRWYKNGALNLTQNFNNNYANGSFFNAILLSGNTTSGDNWSCSVRTHDGSLYSGWGNSSNLTILSSLPPFNFSIVSPINQQQYFNNPISVNVSLNGTGAWCKYSLDGDINVSMVKINDTYFSASNNYLREGSHNLVVYCKDTHATLNSSSVNFDVNIDAPAFMVQRGNVSLDSVSQVNVSVNVSDVTKAFVIVSLRTSDPGPDEGQAIGYLYNNKTLVLEKYGSASSGAFVEWEVVESDSFYVQRGEYPYATTESSFNVDLNNSINTSESFIVFSNKLNSGTNADNYQGFFTVNFTNSTMLYFEREPSISTEGVVSWQAIEWDGASVQSGSISTSGTSVTDALSQSIDENKSFLIISRKLEGDTSMQDSMVLGKLNNTHVTFSRNANGGTIFVNWFVVTHTKIKTQSKEFPLSGTVDPQVDSFYEIVNDSISFSLESHLSTGTGTAYDRTRYTKKINSTNIIFQKGDRVQTGTERWFVVEYIPNQPPTHGTPLLNSSSLTNTTGENLTVYPQGVSDVDGDDVKPIVRWIVDGGSITVLNVPFEGGSNSSWTKDYSGFGNNGTVNGAIWNSTGGYDGFGAYLFDGVNDNIRFGTAPSLDGKANFSISAWIKTEGSSADQTIIQQRDSGYNGEYWVRVTSAGLVNFVVYGNSAYQFNINSATEVDDGLWHHVVVEREGATGRIYIDGNLDASASGTVRDLDDTIGVAIGYDIRDNNHPFNGSIDDVKIFNRSLSSAQIYSLYNNHFREIVSDETLVEEIWKACITPNDGNFDGTEKCSNTLTILGNPIVLDVSTNSSGYFVGDLVNISLDSSPLQTSTLTYVFEGKSSDYWWNSSWNYRDVIAVDPKSYDRSNIVISYPINFTKIFREDFGESGKSLDKNSVRVVEFINNKTFTEVPSQFDEGSNFTNLTNEYGEVVWVLDGTTSSGSTRRFHIYFDDNSSLKSAPSYSNLLETDIGSYREVNWTNQEGRFFDVNIFETSNSTQADRESIISKISVDGTNFTDVLSTGETGITFFDMSPSVGFTYNSTPIKGPVHVRIVLDINLDSGGAKAGQLFLDFYPTRYFRMTSSGKTFDTTNGISWVNPSLTNRGAYETSSGVQEVSSDASFTSTGGWVGIDVYSNTTLILWNKTDSSQSDSGSINFDAGTTNKELPSWTGDAADTDLDIFFAVLNTSNFSKSVSFARSLLENMNVSSVIRNKLVEINQNETSSGGFFSFLFDTVGLNPDNYTVISKATKTDFQTDFDLANFELKSPLGPLPPNVTLTNPSDNYFQNYSEITLFYNVSDLNNNIANATLILNGVENETNSTVIVNDAINNFTVTLPDGIYNWTVNVTDLTNLVGTDENTRNFTIDTQKPKIILYSPSNLEEVGHSAILFNFSANDNLDAFLTCDLVIDSVVYEDDFVLENSTSKNFTETLGVGVHNWNVSCRDDAGNRNASETRSFNVTDSPPAVYLITVNNSFSTTGSINLTYNASDNNGFMNATLLLNGVNYMNNQSAILNNNYNNFSLIGLSEGVYEWDVNVTDDAGTSRINGTSRIFTVDLYAPSISLSSPLNETNSNSSSINFNFTVEDSMDSHLVCNLSVGDTVDENFIVVNGSLVNRQISGISDGEKLWNVTCIDDAGNRGYSENRVITITDYPSVFLNTSENSFFNTSDFNLSYTPFDNVDFSNCSLYVDGGFNKGNQTAVSNGELNNFSLTGVSEGTHNWFVKCFDSYGLENDSQTRNFTVDLSKPNIVLSAPPSGATLFGATITFNYTATDNLDSNISCSVYVNSVLEDSYNASNGTLSSREVVLSDGGTKLWYVSCVDDAGNVNTSETWNFTLQFSPVVNLNSPEINYFSNKSIIALLYEVSDDNDDIANATLILNGVENETNSTVIVNDAINNFTVTLPDGIYNWTVNVTDLTNLVGTDENTRNFTIDTGIPSIVLHYPQDGALIDWNNFTLNFSVSDNLDDVLDCSIYINGSSEKNLTVQNGSVGEFNSVKGDGFYFWNVSCTDEANNTAWSDLYNFTVEAPPNVTLISPEDDNWTDADSIDFKYIPDDPIDINSCELLINGVVNQTEGIPITGSENTFSVNGLSEGEHNWTVGCYDSDSNYYAPNNFTLYIDKTSPNITLNKPGNNSGVDFNQNSVIFNWTATDNLDPFLTCDLYLDGAVERSDLLVSSGIAKLESVSGISQGAHNWSVGCWDTVGNTNVSEVFLFNYTYPDFQVNSSLIFFNDSSPREGDEVLINVTVKDLSVVGATGVEVKFYDGDPDNGGVQIGSDHQIDISSNGESYVWETWTADISLSQIFVIVDPPLSSNGSFNELNESNNLASKNISVGGWHFFYGSITGDSKFLLRENLTNNTIEEWFAENFSRGSIYVSDYESNVAWGSLVALGKNNTGENSSNDFSELDSALGMTSFNDSISNVYLDGGVVENTTSFLVQGKNITDVPVAESINNSNFLTGILWDSSDDSNGEYDFVDKEDVVFVTEINKDKPGAYGTYDYELRVPAKLRSYEGSGGSEVVFYLEIS